MSKKNLSEEDLKELNSSEEVAAKLRPLVIAVDLILQDEPDIELMKRKLKKMKDNDSFLEAWPFPETMRKADNNKATSNFFEAMIKLLEVRKKQMEIAMKPNTTPGEEVLKALGF